MSADDFVTADAPPVPEHPWSAPAFQTPKYGTRYYRDQLPACAIAEPTTATWPGFSSIKPSKPFKKSVVVDGRKQVVPLDLYTAYQYIEANPLVPSAAEFYECVGVAQRRSFARGHAIHAVAEATLLGLPIPQWALDNADAAPYLPQVRQWIEDNVESVVAIEAVVINRSLGYGGTGDAWLRLKSGVDAYVDWKSRGEDSKHDIYMEEIAQGGAYTSAEYMVGPNEDRTGAVRMALPAATHGVVVSVRPDSSATFFYDLEQARTVFGHVLGSYRALSDAGKAATKAKKIAAPSVDPTTEVEQPTAEERTATASLAVQFAAGDAHPSPAAPTLEQLRQNLRERCRTVARIDADAGARMAALWPAGVPLLVDDGVLEVGYLAAIERHVEQFETITSAPFAVAVGQPAPSTCRPSADDPTPPLPDVKPDDGLTLASDDPEFTAMQARYARLDDVGMQWMQRIVGDAIRAKRSIHMGEVRSLRRVRIVDGLVTLAAAGLSSAARGTVFTVLGDEAVLDDRHPLGAVVSLLDVAQALAFAVLCRDIVAPIARAAA